MLSIDTERQAGTLIAVVGERVDGANAREFQSELESAISETDGGVILDMKNLAYISSAGLRVILLTAKSLQRQQSKFAVCSLSGAVQEIFEISGFDKIIEVHSTRADAINAVGGG